MVEAQACTPGSPVVHYRVTGGVHEWFRIQGFDTTNSTIADDDHKDINPMSN